MSDDWPPLCIMLLTYADHPDSPRAEYARTTLRCVLDRLSYSGPLYVHIADDGSFIGHRDELKEIAGGYPHVVGVTATSAGRSGYGASYNQATQVVHGYRGIVLPLEDDWVLWDLLNVDAYVEALIEGSLSCIRLGYIGFTQELRGTLVHVAGKTYLKFDPNSEERHVCAGHPRLETVAFERRIGPWPEGVDPGMTEFVWCGRDESREGVGWPMDTPVGSWFRHIGTVQARDDQKAEAVA